jgi:glycosyltransferase involved in cell wall biosynthesis
MMDQLRILMLSTYPPTRCGIATFSRDLVLAMEESPNGPAAQVSVAAIDREGAHTSRSGQVVYTVNPDKQDSYRILANFVNRSDYDVVCLQHEYGLFGGSWGHHLLEFLRRCEKPIVTICHTVMEDPTSEAVSVLQEVARHSAAIVVMANAAIEMLERHYNIRGENIVVIPHGVPQFRFAHRQSLKDNLGLLGKQVISTFGLVSRGKGLETMIKAMHYVLQANPDAVYVIVGQTHPAVLAQEGESYRQELQHLAASLPNPNAVQFVNRFIKQAEIGEYLQATDVYVAPYPGYNQITSGTLSFALAAGKAIVSTPYIHAIEALAHGRGVLVPFRDESMMAQAVNCLLADRTLRETIEMRAYRAARGWVWPAIGGHYVQLLNAAAAGSLQSLLADMAGASLFGHIGIPSARRNPQVSGTARATG